MVLQMEYSFQTLLTLAKNNCIFLMTSIFLAGTLYQDAYAENLCDTKEKPLFSCKIDKSEKSVSLCQSEYGSEKIIYKYGTTNKIEMTLPTIDSGKPFTCFERFGKGSTQWIQEAAFPSKGIAYVLSTPQGMSVSLSIRPTASLSKKSSIFLRCDSGPNGDAYRGGDLNDAINLMRDLHYPEKKCLSYK